MTKVGPWRCWSTQQASHAIWLKFGSGVSRLGALAPILSGILTFTFAAAPNATASGFSNYNSVLIGDMAAGMGGAFTGLTGDPAACSFYNPATLARMKGTSLSATANVYHKYDTEYGTTRDFLGAGTRINRGSFRSIPASAGSVAAFGPFALGLSIIVPSYDFYSGPIKSEQGQNTSLNLSDESLWVGGNMAINLSEASSLGMTFYYTSRFYQKQIVDNQKRDDGTAILTTEEKTFNNNSLVYLLGYYHKFTPNWSAGVSFRFPSIEVHGRGTYFYTNIDTALTNTPTEDVRNEIPSESRIPSKLAFGVAYSVPGKHTVSFDSSYYGRESFVDMDYAPAAESVEHREIWNFALGAEVFLKHWLRFRFGTFTNFSSHYPIESTPSRRPDYIDMWGFSSNFGVFTSDKVSFTFGGYYTGGTGYTVERLDNSLQKIRKSQHVLSMLIGSAYFF